MHGLRHAKLENVNEGLSTPPSRGRAAASGWPLEARLNGDPRRPGRPRYAEHGRKQLVEPLGGPIFFLSISYIFVSVSLDVRGMVLQ